MMRSLVEKLEQTLNIVEFLSEVRGLDFVTQRQCLLRAMRALSASSAVDLHGARAVKRVLSRLGEELRRIPTGARMEVRLTEQIMPYYQ